MANEIDDMMDDFEFKPLTKGLGFHHSLTEKSEVRKELNSRTEEIHTDIDERAKMLLKSFEEKKEVTHMGELSPFYENVNESIEDIPKLSDKVEKETIRFFDAPMFLRLAAYSIDLIVISIMFAMTLISIFVLADLPFDTLSSFMISNDILPSFTFIFFLFYAFYFSVLDKTEYSTVGKNLMNIKVISKYSLRI